MWGRAFLGALLFDSRNLGGNGVTIQAKPSARKPRTSSAITAGYSSGA